MHTEPVFGNPALNTTIIKWGSQTLVTLGYTLLNTLPEAILNPPWSYVARFETTEGYIYLKHTPTLLALEAPIIKILEEQFSASVPTIIAHNAELHCFLMKDAGLSLRSMLKQKFDTVLLCKAITQFTALQLTIAEHVEVFLDIGVPDWRLDNLPGLYQALLSQKDLLKADGLSETEITEAEQLISQVTQLCQTLSTYGIKETLVQIDFNDNNTLIDPSSQKITLIDVGEIIIAHPFLSLLNCLQQVKKHYGLKDHDKAYLQILAAYLKNYEKIYSHSHLLEALDATQCLWDIYGMLGQYRLILACGQDKMISFQPGRLSSAFKEFIMICRNGLL